MGDNRAKRQSEHGEGPLRRGDQLVVALVVLLGLGGVVVWRGCSGIWSGELVEFDQAEPYEVTFTLDINEAEWPEFAQLPGVGESLARRIVDERKRGGRFASVEDLDRRVSGIGPKIFAAIKPHLRPVEVRDETTGSLNAEPNGEE